MKRHSLYFALAFILVFPLLLTSCPLACAARPRFSEIRVGLIGTNIIGFVSANKSGEPHYITIEYSAADTTRPGHNITKKRENVSLPYLFQNDSVYMTYRYEEWDSFSNVTFSKWLHRNFAEGGAEYFRVVNHSPDKVVEFFLVGTFTDLSGAFFSGAASIPDIWYRNAPVYFLLHPERKPDRNITAFGNVIIFEGYRIGDITVTDPWSIEKVANLYRAEFSRCAKVQLMFRLHRVIELVEDSRGTFSGRTFFGAIEPGGELRGNENLWLLGTVMLPMIGAGWL
jgi:hypothetical protein